MSDYYYVNIDGLYYPTNRFGDRLEELRDMVGIKISEYQGMTLVNPGHPDHYRLMRKLVYGDAAMGRSTPVYPKPVYTHVSDTLLGSVDCTKVWKHRLAPFRDCQCDFRVLDEAVESWLRMRVDERHWVRGDVVPSFWIDDDVVLHEFQSVWVDDVRNQLVAFSDFATGKRILTLGWMQPMRRWPWDRNRSDVHLSTFQDWDKFDLIHAMPKGSLDEVLSWLVENEVVVRTHPYNASIHVLDMSEDQWFAFRMRWL